MPAFNTNLFKLASEDYLCTHVHQAVEVSEHLTGNQVARQENMMKAYQKLKQSTSKGDYKTKLTAHMAAAADADNSSNKVDFFLLSQQVNALCDQIDDTGIMGLIKDWTYFLVG